MLVPSSSWPHAVSFLAGILGGVYLINNYASSGWFATETKTRNKEILQQPYTPRSKGNETKNLLLLRDRPKPQTGWDHFLHLAETRKTKCPLPNVRYGEPVKQIGDFLDSQGRLFLIGDSVMGQLCALGTPGLCCNSRYPCHGKGQQFVADGGAFRELNATDYNSTQGSWQHLWYAVGRGTNNSSPDVYYLAPSTNPKKAPRNTEDGGVGLMTEFLDFMNVSEHDILVAGLMGNHYHNTKEFPLYETFCVRLVTQIVNQFPGRVVLLGASPQHFKGDGAYTEKGIKQCGPFIPGLDRVPGTVEMRQSIWNYMVYKHLDHYRVRVVDVFQTLSILWACHKQPAPRTGTTAVDCLHWNDMVYSLLADLVMESLESVEQFGR